MASTANKSADLDSGRANKRRRVKTARYDVEFLDNEEQMMLQQVNTLIFSGLSQCTIVQ
jgi:hypothetical protein